MAACRQRPRAPCATQPEGARVESSEAGRAGPHDERRREARRRLRHPLPRSTDGKRTAPVPGRLQLGALAVVEDPRTVRPHPHRAHRGHHLPPVGAPIGAHAQTTPLARSHPAPTSRSEVHPAPSTPPPVDRMPGLGGPAGRESALGRTSHRGPSVELERSKWPCSPYRPVVVRSCATLDRARSWATLLGALFSHRISRGRSGRAKVRPR